MVLDEICTALLMSFGSKVHFLFQITLSLSIGMENATLTYGMEFTLRETV